MDLTEAIDAGDHALLGLLLFLLYPADPGELAASLDLSSPSTLVTLSFTRGGLHQQLYRCNSLLASAPACFLESSGVNLV